jgi:hypothetical protein
MPISRKKTAAKKRLSYQLRNTDSGQFALQYSNSEDEYSPSSSDSNYSSDISDENYCAQRMLKLGDISFVLTGIAYFIWLKFLFYKLIFFYFYIRMFRIGV